MSTLLAGIPISSLEKIESSVAEELGMRLFPKGTVLFAKSGMSCMTGNVYMLPEPCYVVSHLACVVAGDELLSHWLLHFFRYNKPNSLIENPSFPSIKLSRLSSIEVILPDQEEMLREVQTLNTIEEQNKLCKEQMEKLDRLIKSRFVEMFGELENNPNGWPICQFTEFARIDTHMTNDFVHYANVPHIGIDSIESSSGRLRGYRTVAKDNVKSGKYLFDTRHIIYSKIRPALNKVALPEFDGVCSADAYPILPDGSICDRVFLAYVMRSEFFLDYILPLSARAQMPKVNKDALMGFSMPPPPLDIQQQFADFVAQVDKSRFVCVLASQRFTLADVSFE